MEEKRKGVSAVTENLILIMVVVAILLVTAVCMSISITKAENELKTLNTSIEEMKDGEEADNVRGYGIAILLVNAAVIVVKVIFVWLPIFQAFYFSVLAGIARYIYKPTNGRQLAYRILMGFVYGGIVLLGVEIGFLISIVPFFTKQLMLIGLEFLLLFILVWNVRNTYTKRIVQ